MQWTYQRKVKAGHEEEMGRVDLFQGRFRNPTGLRERAHQQPVSPGKVGS